MRALLVSLLFLALACERDLQGLQCEGGGCDDGYFCELSINICVPNEGCTEDADCGPAATCEAGVCFGGDVVIDCGECDLQNRNCTDGRCEGCFPGFVEGPGPECVPGGPDCVPDGVGCDPEGPPCCDGLGCPASGVCADVLCSQLSEPCVDDGACCEGLSCNGISECANGCAPDGGGCIVDADCCLGSTCQAGTCGRATPCGNAQLDPGELCDADLFATDCVNEGFAGGGIIACFIDCTLDTAQCLGCGDGSVDPNLDEQCEPPNSQLACSAVGLGSGEADCNSECRFTDLSVCGISASCGNGVRGELNETCEPDDTLDCSTLVGVTNPMAIAPCLDSCRGFDVHACCLANQFFDGNTCADATPECGNGVVDTGEGCDDGNTLSGDGCDPGCFIEPGAHCILMSAPSACRQLPLNCNNGFIEPEAGEQCDAVGGLCNPDCTQGASCPDGFVTGAEECDDGNIIEGDGCDGSCLLEGCPGPNATCVVDTDCCPAHACQAGRCRGP